MVARAAAWTLWIVAACSGGEADEGEAPREFQVKEGEEFVVPAGRVAVVTWLGSDQATITDVGLMVDGKTLLSNTPDRGPDETTVLVTACAGARLSVFGGLIEKDARCRGYLVAEGNVALGCK
jgi:hypothetical protein